MANRHISNIYFIFKSGACSLVITPFLILGLRCKANLFLTRFLFKSSLRSGQLRLPRGQGPLVAAEVVDPRCFCHLLLYPHRLTGFGGHSIWIDIRAGIHSSAVVSLHDVALKGSWGQLLALFEIINLLTASLMCAMVVMLRFVIMVKTLWQVRELVCKRAWRIHYIWWNHFFLFLTYYY